MAIYDVLNPSDPQADSPKAQAALDREVEATQATAGQETKAKEVAAQAQHEANAEASLKRNPVI